MSEAELPAIISALEKPPDSIVDGIDKANGKSGIAESRGKYTWL